MQISAAQLNIKIWGKRGSTFLQFNKLDFCAQEIFKTIVQKELKWNNNN